MIPDVPYRFTIRPLPADEGGGYLIEFPDLPGCMSDEATIEETITNGLDAMRGWIEAMRAEGHPISRTDPLGCGMGPRPTVPLAEVCEMNPRLPLPAHRAALHHLGPCRHHDRSFMTVRGCLFDF